MQQLVWSGRPQFQRETNGPVRRKGPDLAGQGCRRLHIDDRAEAVQVSQPPPPINALKTPCRRLTSPTQKESLLAPLESWVNVSQPSEFSGLGMPVLTSHSFARALSHPPHRKLTGPTTSTPSFLFACPNQERRELNCLVLVLVFSFCSCSRLLPQRSL